jgi:fumarate reductase flavoprotein subunit
VPDYDVVIVGAGAAGLCSALAAHDRGASVLLAAASDSARGASWFSTGVVLAAGTRFQLMHGIEDSPDSLFLDYMNFNRWNVEPAVIRRFAQESGPTLEWVADMGVEISKLYFSGDERVPRGHVVAGGGEAIVECLLGVAKRSSGIDLAFGRRVDRLVTDDQGRVCGVAADGEEVSGRTVVLATGGFGASQDLWPTYLPRAVSTGWTFYTGPPSSRGDIFALTAPLSAQIAGYDRGQFSIRPHFAPIIESYYPGWLVFVDAAGRRFVNEMTAYSVIEAIVRARGGRAWAVFDDAAKRAAKPHSTTAAKRHDMPVGSGWEDWIEPVIDEMLAKGRVVAADTLEELGRALDMPSGALSGSIGQYNLDAVRGEDTHFEKPGTVMRPVATSPFYAAEVRPCSMGLTACGPRIDRDAHVLDVESRPIPGLLAAGECTGGVLGDVYMGSGNALANALTFGRIAGITASSAAS